MSLWVIFWVILSSFHPFYVSVSEINFNNSKVQVSIKCFTNDLETVLRKKNSFKIDILDTLQFNKSKHLLNEYVKKNFSISYNKKQLDLTMLGFEKEEDAIWMYFENNYCKTKKTNLIEIKNTILFDLNNEQLNIVHVTLNNQRTSAKIKQPDTSCRFSF